MTIEPLLRKIYSLVFVRDYANKKILLGFKKRGFGINKWNGLGGKCEPNETIIECAKREANEESGLEILSLKQVAFLEFQFESKMNETLEANVFIVDEFKGEIRECDEIRPQWFNENEIPFDKMWKDDIHWLPHVIQNKCLKAYFLFKDDEETIVSQRIELVDKIQ